MPLIPEAAKVQVLTPLATDRSVMNRRQKAGFMVDAFWEAYDEYENQHGRGPKAFFKEKLVSADPLDQRMMLQMAMKLAAPVISEMPEEAKNNIIDFPWLTRTRLAYQDPQRLALIKNEGDIEDAVLSKKD